MKLDDYLSQRGITNTQFAIDIGVERSNVSRLRRGLISPSFDMMQRIAKATEHQVMPNDFLALVTTEATSSNSEVAA
jgi:transcriptional regulator with XRE-family HTH domain